jgi:hypothetical protein
VTARALALALVACAASPAWAQADDGEPQPVRYTLDPQLELHLGYDSNARREPVKPVGDGLLKPILSVSGRAASSRFVLRGSANLGGKLFFDRNKPPPDTPDWTTARATTTTATERMIVAQASGSLLTRLPLELRATLDAWAKARAQPSLNRTYARSQSRFALARRLGWGFDVNANVAGSWYQSVALPAYSNFEGAGGLGVVYAPTSRESFELTAGLGVAAFPFLKPCDSLDGTGNCVAPPNEDIRRLDTPLRSSLRFSSFRRVFLSAGYSVEHRLSNSIGDPFTRHRLWGMVGFKLPADVTASMRGTVQLSHYPEGISIAQRDILEQDDEGQNNIVLRLDRAWAYGITFIGQLAWFGRELSNSDLGTSRMTAEMGVRLSL